MKRLLMLAILTGCEPVAAAEADCLTRILHAEARGESLTGLVAVGHATVNRAKAAGKTACNVTGVSRSTPAATEYAAYRTIAAGILNGKIKNPVKQANAWNTGTKPRQPGSITRVIGKHVFYAMADKP